jgi:hypothetical protein
VAGIWLQSPACRLSGSASLIESRSTPGGAAKEKTASAIARLSNASDVVHLPAMVDIAGG